MELKFVYESRHFNLEVHPKCNFDNVIDQVAEYLNIEPYNICLTLDEEILWHDVIIQDSLVTQESVIQVSLNEGNLIDWDDVFNEDDEDDEDCSDRSFPGAKYFYDYIGDRYSEDSEYTTTRNGTDWSIYLPVEVNNSDWYEYGNGWWKNHINPTDNIILILTSDDGGRVTFQIGDFICIAGCHGCHPYVETREISFGNSDGSSSFSYWLRKKEINPENIIGLVNKYLVTPCH